MALFIIHVLSTTVYMYYNVIYPSHWTFLHRFASLLGSWLIAMVLGLLYKRFLVGAKGWEQVPLIGWYREFGNLQAVSINSSLVVPQYTIGILSPSYVYIKICYLCTGRM